MICSPSWLTPLLQVTSPCRLKSPNYFGIKWISNPCTMTEFLSYYIIYFSVNWNLGSKFIKSMAIASALIIASSNASFAKTHLLGSYVWLTKKLPLSSINSLKSVFPLKIGLAAKTNAFALIAFAMGNVIRPCSV